MGRRGEFWWTDEVSPGKCVCGPQETSFKQRDKIQIQMIVWGKYIPTAMKIKNLKKKIHCCECVQKLVSHRRPSLKSSICDFGSFSSICRPTSTHPSFFKDLCNKLVRIHSSHYPCVQSVPLDEDPNFFSY